MRTTERYADMVLVATDKLLRFLVKIFATSLIEE